MWKKAARGRYRGQIYNLLVRAATGAVVVALYAFIAKISVTKSKFAALYV